MMMLLKLVTVLVLILTTIWVGMFGFFFYNAFKERPQGEDQGPY